MTETTVAAIRSRLEKATPGPWEMDDSGNALAISQKADHSQWIATLYQSTTGQLANAELVANAPTDLAFLLAENERLTKALELIAAQDGMTLFASSMGLEYDKGHQVGANMAFNQMADIARTTLSRTTGAEDE